MSRTILTALSLTIALAAAGDAQAHAHLLKASPAIDATVAAPRTLDLQFSEALEAKFSGADLRTAAGAEVAAVASVTAKDRKTLHVAPNAPLTPGAYRVLWHVVSADGHRIKGDYGFTVK